MTEHREGPGCSTFGIVLVLIGGMVILALVLVLGFGVFVMGNRREQMLADLARAEEMRAREMAMAAELQARQLREQQEEEKALLGLSRNQSASEVDFDEVQRGRRLAENFVRLLKDREFEAARNLMVEPAAEGRDPAALREAIADKTGFQEPFQIVGIIASAKAQRFYLRTKGLQGESWELVLTINRDAMGLRISRVEWRGVGPAGGE